MELQREVAHREVSIAAGRVILDGSLSVPESPSGIVLFAHGSGSSRHSPRNRFVAEVLQSWGMATLLFDLLTRQEEAVDRQTGQLRFDIELLARRLLRATYWVKTHGDIASLNVGYFGASTGAAAALVAASLLRETVAAIVSRGGRPDLAGDSLGLVRAPTLLIVGGHDEMVLDLNREAMARMISAPAQLKIIPGATHLFEEAGALEEVSRLAAEWFAKPFAAVAAANLAGHG